MTNWIQNVSVSIESNLSDHPPHLLRVSVLNILEVEQSPFLIVHRYHNELPPLLVVNESSARLNVSGKASSSMSYRGLELFPLEDIVFLMK